MIPSENCVECGEKLTNEEQLMYLDVCSVCECAMWLGDECEQRDCADDAFFVEQDGHGGIGLSGRIERR